MRRTHKYKTYSRIDISPKFPKRLLNLKRPKWNSLKDDLKVILADQENFNLIDSDVLLGETFGWDRVSRTYKSRLEFYASLSTRFDQSVKIRRLKSYKIVSRFDNYVKHLAEGYFKVTALLWATYFFKSTFEAKQHIDGLNITLNGTKLRSNEFLSSGDVLSVLDSKFKLVNNLNKYSDNNQILSFVELDYYSQSAVVLKDIQNLSEEDLNLLLIDSLGLSL